MKMGATLTRETAALSGARHFWEMCLINSGRHREQSQVPRSTVRSRWATSWRKREFKPAVPQVTGRCRDHGMRLLLLLAFLASGGISQFSLIHLEMTIHAIATMPSTSWRPARITKHWNLLQRQKELGPLFGLNWLLVDVEWFPLRFLAEEGLAGSRNSWMLQCGSYDRFTPGSVSVLYSKWLTVKKISPLRMCHSG